MKTMNDIKSTYQSLGAIHTLDKALKKTKGYSILDVLIVKMAYDSNEFIKKTEIEKKLTVSPAMTQKSTKQLRKDGYIIKDRDIDDESIIIIGMTNEMRKKAESLFKEVEAVQQEILNGNNPAKKEDNSQENSNNESKPDDNKHNKEHNKDKNNNPAFNKKHK